MWDLIYPSKCLHCQSQLIRERPFTLKPPLFCPDCLDLIEIKMQHKHVVWMNTKRWKIYPLFDWDSPFFSLYKQQHMLEGLSALMASFLTLLMQNILLEKERSVYFASLLKEESFQLKKSAFYTLYSTIKEQFVDDAHLIWPKMGFFSPSHAGFHKEGSSKSGDRAVMVIEVFKKPMQNALDRAALFLKKEEGFSSVDVYVLFS